MCNSVLKVDNWLRLTFFHVIWHTNDTALALLVLLE